MKVLLASPRGFCAGVNMAIATLDRALEMFGAPLYVYHEIVHNKHVVERFQTKGVVFVEDIGDVPEGETVVFSAHGVSPHIRSEARARGLNAIDATCPLVMKVHSEAVRFARRDYTILLIGHEGHDEIVGTIGEAPDRIVLVESPEAADALDLPADANLAYLSQTTLSVDDANAVIARLKARFPGIAGPPNGDICYATQNRQRAVREMAAEADVVIVIGSQNSSNSKRLAEIAQELGRSAYLIDTVDQIDPGWFAGAAVVAVTAGASAPESLVSECVEYLRARFGASVEERVTEVEDVAFQLPPQVRPRRPRLALGA